MTEPFNPYAPPRSAIEEQAVDSDNAAWQAGKVLVMRQDGGLPHRCVKCNEPAVEPMKKFKLYWHHPGWYVLIFVNLLIYAIVAMCVRKRAEVRIGLCTRHLQRYRVGRWVGWGGSLGMLLVAFVGAGSGSNGLLLTGVLGFLISLIAAMVFARVLHPASIKQDFVRMKGAGRAFLDSLPEFPR